MSKDLSQLSDEELFAIVGQQPQAAPSQDLNLNNPF